MRQFDSRQLNWTKVDGLMPAIIQHAYSGDVLMLGYMNADALEQTESEGQVTFYSRTRQCLWTKGESSGNTLSVCSIGVDCDGDTLLIQVLPAGPTCHTGAESCFPVESRGVMSQLNARVNKRLESQDPESYTVQLNAQGKKALAQKVGEEGVEVVIAALSESQERLLEETADLIFHCLLLLKNGGCDFLDVLGVLYRRFHL